MKFMRTLGQCFFIGMTIVSCKTTVKGTNSEVKSDRKLSIRSVDNLRESASLSDIYFICSDIMEAEIDGFPLGLCGLRIPHFFIGEYVTSTIQLKVKPQYDKINKDLFIESEDGKKLVFATFDAETGVVLRDDEGRPSDGIAYKVSFQTSKMSISLEGPTLDEKQQSVYTLVVK